VIFDYLTAAKRVGISPDQLERLCAIIRVEFPSDEMMAELHILRAIQSIERGDTTIEAILNQDAPSG
jgi:hypothetical protein